MVENTKALEKNNIEGTRQNDSVTSGEGGPTVKLISVRCVQSDLKKHCDEGIDTVIGWCHRKGGSDCLVKTQDSAKLKNEV